MMGDRSGELKPPQLKGCAVFGAVMAGVGVLTGIGIVLFARNLLDGPYHEVGEEPPLYVTEYDAVIGPADKVDKAGRRLMSDQAILARDRENVEVHGVHQPGDSISRQIAESRSGSPSHPFPGCWEVLRNAWISGTEDSRRAIQTGEQPIHVTIYFSERYGRYIAHVKRARVPDNTE